MLNFQTDVLINRERLWEIKSQLHHFHYRGGVTLGHTCVCAHMKKNCVHVSVHPISDSGVLILKKNALIKIFLF